MILLPLAWTLLAVSLWTSGSSQILQQQTLDIRYPELLSTEVIDCDCGDILCDSVYWFRSNSSHSNMQYLGRCNNADRSNHGNGVDKARFRLNRKNSLTFTLRIISVTVEDAGIYSCVLRDKKNTEIWKSGVLLRPGVLPPTLPPETKPPSISVCSCPKKKPTPEGCGSLILWPLVGLLAALAFALICTLYYFSRLPKKCRHRFVKKR